MQRRYPIGAEIISKNETHFRVWAPKANMLDVVLEPSSERSVERTFHPLPQERDGYFSGTVTCGIGARYRFRLNRSGNFHPDPASRFQPDGPHSSSYVVDPFAFTWTDANWRGVKLAVDVSYNHFGPDRNYLGDYSDDYMNRERENEWGDSINFDGENCGPVREFFITNGRYWIEEFHFDGFRFDATQSIHDKSQEYIVGAIGRAAREAAGKRSILLFAENELQEAKLIRTREQGGDHLDGVWNDDWHHAAVVALTGRNEAYYSDYRGCPQEFISAAKYGYLYQGQAYSWQEAPRGYPSLDLKPEAFVSFLENHDQVSNSATGDRLRLQTSPGRYRAMTALLLLGPWTPLLFQGEEFGASTPFLYFSEVGDEKLREAVKKGRFDLLAQFPSAASAKVTLAVPYEIETFRRCKLDWSEREKNHAFSNLHQDLIKLRHNDSRLCQQSKGGIDGAELRSESLALRYFDKMNDDRLLIVNFGGREELTPAPEPLLAPPADFTWKILWTSDSRRYGGQGAVSIETDEKWVLPAESALVFRPRRRREPRKQRRRREKK